jgi:hypothetical protein
MRRLAADMLVVGRHAVGAVTAEIEFERSAAGDVQVQWAVTVRRTPGEPSSYPVPIVGDSWCSIQETFWTSTTHRHVTSSLNCRHLPATDRNSKDVGLTLIVKALDGALQYERRLLSSRTTSSASDSLDWRLPRAFAGSGPQRRRLVDVGHAILLNFSLIVISRNSSPPISAIRLSWTSGGGVFLTENASSSPSQIDVTWKIDNTSKVASNRSCDDSTMLLNISGRADDVIVTCRRTTLTLHPGGDTGDLFTVSVFVGEAAISHAGTYIAEFWRGPGTGSTMDGDDGETISFPVDLIVVAHQRLRNDLIVHDDDYNGEVSDGDDDRWAAAQFRLRMRTCSNATWSDRPSSDFRLRTSMPDCVYCESTGRWPVDVELYRADGMLLGSEESHSVYWYRESSRVYVAVLLLRDPTDEYSGDYVCAATSTTAAGGSGGMGKATAAAAAAPKTATRRHSDGSRKRRGGGPEVDARKDARRIRFSLTVQ